MSTPQDTTPTLHTMSDLHDHTDTIVDDINATRTAAIITHLGSFVARIDPIEHLGAEELVGLGILTDADLSIYAAATDADIED